MFKRLCLVNIFAVIFFTVLPQTGLSDTDENIKICGTSLAVARGGVLTLTQMEPTDVSQLTGQAMAQVIKSLTGYWVQFTTRDAIPLLGNPVGTNTFLMKVKGTGQGVRFRQSVSTVEGEIASAQHNVLPEVFLSDLTSVQLVDLPEITVKIDGPAPKTRTLAEKVSEVADGDQEATVILAKLSDARFPYLNVKAGEEFETFVSILEQSNIRGRNLVAAFRDYADSNIATLISGIIHRPHDVAKAIRRTHIPQQGDRTVYKTFN